MLLADVVFFVCFFSVNTAEEGEPLQWQRRPQQRRTTAGVRGSDDRRMGQRSNGPDLVWDGPSDGRHVAKIGRASASGG